MAKWVGAGRERFEQYHENPPFDVLWTMSDECLSGETATILGRQ
ncbi:hypothetical protein HMPREF0682_0676 [Propionibacterium acidifaciens F0233]|uniref:Uncharacterized protein n=1 Tax=Propionibacterium acidifaciens F0233 TaxID=553198 RepID=U2QG71_9ACTN|nr:hypothetical protein HMPREF0682_0676 [Propionibacterium acidifaciens F0233]